MEEKPSRGAALLPLLRLLWLLPRSWAVPAVVFKKKDDFLQPGVTYPIVAPGGLGGGRDFQDSLVPVKWLKGSQVCLHVCPAYTPVWRDDLQNHTFRHTVFCQEGTPSIGLSESYDEDLLFSFDFSKNTRVPRLPDFADWAQDQSDAPAIAFDKQFCEMMVQQLDPVLDGQIPVSRGFPVPEVFTLKPLEFGKPNTLVCFVSNLFPPMLTVSWEHNSEPVEGVGPTFVSAVDGLSFQAFSYLNFTPEHSDVFSCMATHEIDRYTAIAYWVPHNALPSDLLENVLCGVAFGLGVLGIIVGPVLTVYFGWPCSGGMSSGRAAEQTQWRESDMPGLPCGGGHSRIHRPLGAGPVSSTIGHIH
ncbi:HLA class II histocompatibility antigen, DM alpha chain [Heterocephalus glaber]|uniref:HLA class II histocompatibility antigen, DM alpha chain n=1 Tax=Heterocephalus glaber TaxID=10181 RepID=G5BB05_HETGA|nr:HLA class II histocompatibility antigen, DM alpha chain [Heterocephalus glaber]